MLRMRSGVSKDRPIMERKTVFDGSVQEFACHALLIEPGKRAVIRYELERDWHVGGMIFPKGRLHRGPLLDRPAVQRLSLAGIRTDARVLLQRRARRRDQ